MKKVALVTGVSSGIGRATALALKASGFEVFGTSRKPGFALDGINILQMDVTDDGSVRDGIDKIISRTGQLDLLVNNAGFGVLGAAEESSVDQGKALFETNLFGIIRTTRAVLPVMRAQRSGRIVNISSVLGFIPSPGMALYAASKHALEGYSESVDHEMRTHGIRVILVQPAFTRTSFDQNMIASDLQLPLYDGLRNTIGSVAAEAMQIGDEPEVVAKAVTKAALATKPRLRYPAGATARNLTFLRRFVPSFGFDRTLRKQMKLDTF